MYQIMIFSQKKTPNNYHQRYDLYFSFLLHEECVSHHILFGTMQVSCGTPRELVFPPNPLVDSRRWRFCSPPCRTPWLRYIVDHKTPWVQRLYLWIIVLTFSIRPWIQYWQIIQHYASYKTFANSVMRVW